MSGYRSAAYFWTAFSKRTGKICEDDKRGVPLLVAHPGPHFINNHEGARRRIGRVLVTITEVDPETERPLPVGGYRPEGLSGERRKPPPRKP